MFDFELDPVIAAVRDEQEFRKALESEPTLIFLLSSDIGTIGDKIGLAHEKGKKLFIHMDFAAGLGKDEEGVAYIKMLGADGIISTRTNIVRYAKEAGLLCVQRFFMVDSRSVDTAIESVHQSHADMAEVMPGIAYKAIAKLKSNLRIPIIAGGLIEEKNEIMKALTQGASAISTSNSSLWNE